MRTIRARSRTEDRLGTIGIPPVGDSRTPVVHSAGNATPSPDDPLGRVTSTRPDASHPPPERIPMQEPITDHFAYGGQAVLEGVMMRGRRELAVAVRAPSGEIVVWSDEVRSSRLARKVRKWPFVRGAVLLWDTLALGMRALVFSANVGIAVEEDERREGAGRGGRSEEGGGGRRSAGRGGALGHGGALDRLLDRTLLRAAAGGGGVSGPLHRVGAGQQHRRGVDPARAVGRLHLRDRLRAGHQAGLRLPRGGAQDDPRLGGGRRARPAPRPRATRWSTRAAAPVSCWW